eukprot:724720-Alexandrium_andersonii.AAC.1
MQIRAPPAPREARRLRHRVKRGASGARLLKTGLQISAGSEPLEKPLGPVGRAGTAACSTA